MACHRAFTNSHIYLDSRLYIKIDTERERERVHTDSIYYNKTTDWEDMSLQLIFPLKSMLSWRTYSFWDPSP